MIQMEVLEKLAKRVVNEPWGCGDPFLASNYESWAPYQRWLKAVIAQYQPKAVLECGVYMGVATAHMAIGNPFTKVVGIDNNFHPAAKHVVERYVNIRLIEADTRTEEAKRKVLQYIAPGELGLIFLDSEHDGLTAIREFENFKDLFADECIVACDDLIGPPETNSHMQAFWNWLPGEKMELHMLHPRRYDDYPVPGFGVSIVRK